MISTSPLWLFVALLWVHWLADFVCQTHWQASNKSKSLNALGRHVASYTAILALFSVLILSPVPVDRWAWFVALNGALHFATDYVTSRWSAKFYAQQDWHNFFVVIGFDQLIHQVTLAATFWWLIVRS